MSSRRALSPPGRRFDNYGRSSAGQLPHSSYEMPSSYPRRESVTSPRSSNERVIPISQETYVNGQLVGASRNASRTSSDRYNDRPRRTPYEIETRVVPSSTSSSQARPAASAASDDRLFSPTKASALDSGYGSQAPQGSNIRREHKKVYSIDDGRFHDSKYARAAPERDIKRRDELDTARHAPLPEPGSRREYHASAPAPREVTDHGAYEYTDARGMYRDTEPKWRPRQGSVDAPRRERPSSMIADPYGSSFKASARDLGGPPPTTRGLDRISGGGISRHESLRSSVRSPPRSRDRSYSNYSEDDNYPVKPRISAAMPDPTYFPPERADIYSPTREGFDERREPRSLNRRYEDSDVASRGFGIRTNSADRYEPGNRDFDRRDPYVSETSSLTGRREYPPEISREDLKASEWRERDRDFPKPIERDSARSSDKDLSVRDRDLPPRDRDLAPLRDRDLPIRDRDLTPRDKDLALRDRDLPPRERDIPPRDRDLPLRDRDLPLRDRDLPPSDRNYPVRDRDISSKDRDLPVRSNSLVPRERGLDRDRDRDMSPGDRTIPPREKDLPPIDKDLRERPLDIPYDDGRRARDRVYGPESELIVGEDSRRMRDHRPDRNLAVDRDQDDARSDSGSHTGSTVAKALAGTAAAGAVAYGAKEGYDRRHRDERDERLEREARPPRGAEERRRDDRPSVDRGVEEPDRHRHPADSPDLEKPRARHYVAKEDRVDDIDRRGETKTKHSEMLDPDEEYRRRVQQEADRVRQARPEDSHGEGEHDRERRRHERELRHSRHEDTSSRHRDPERYRPTDRDSDSDRADDSKAMAPYKGPHDSVLDGSQGGEISSPGDGERENRVRIVEPPKEKEKPKGILRKPTDKFPEDPNPVREGVTIHKDSKDKAPDIPKDARWTKIDRRIVNPEALDEAKERYEERQDFVIVLRPISREEIQKLADRTKEIRGTDPLPGVDIFRGLPPSSSKGVAGTPHHRHETHDAGGGGHGGAHGGGGALVESVVPFISDILTSYLQKDEREERHQREKHRHSSRRERRDYDGTDEERGSDEGDGARPTRQLTWA